MENFIQRLSYVEILTDVSMIFLYTYWNKYYTAHSRDAYRLIKKNREAHFTTITLLSFTSKFHNVLKFPFIWQMFLPFF